MFKNSFKIFKIFIHVQNLTGAYNFKLLDSYLIFLKQQKIPARPTCIPIPPIQYPSTTTHQYYFYFSYVAVCVSV